MFCPSDLLHLSLSLSFTVHVFFPCILEVIVVVIRTIQRHKCINTTIEIRAEGEKNAESNFIMYIHTDLGASVGICFLII